MDLEELKKLAGTHLTVVDHDPAAQMQQASETAHKNKQYEKENNIKPGDPEWFSLHFGQSNGYTNMPAGFRGRKG